jgi:endonuclease-3 related protein
LRRELLELNGIGPETADTILLAAGGLPSFVVDTPTQRVLKRHGLVDFEADYHAVKEYCEAGLEPDVPRYQQFHALLARVGDDYCRKTARCERCPLRELLPESGPLEPMW